MGAEVESLAGRPRIRENPVWRNDKRRRCRALRAGAPVPPCPRPRYGTSLRAEAGCGREAPRCVRFSGSPAESCQSGIGPKAAGPLSAQPVGRQCAPIPVIRRRRGAARKRTLLGAGAVRQLTPRKRTLSDYRHHKRPKHRYDHHPRPSYPATVDPVQCPICCDQTYKNEADRTQICGPKWQCSTNRPRIHPSMLGENRQWVNDRFPSLLSRSGPI